MGSCFKQLLTKRNICPAFQQTKPCVGYNIIFVKKFKPLDPNSKSKTSIIITLEIWDLQFEIWDLQRRENYIISV
jgi:hypothetical protein